MIPALDEIHGQIGHDYLRLLRASVVDCLRRFQFELPDTCLTNGSTMGLYDRDYMRKGFGGPPRWIWLSRRNLPVVLVVAAVIAFVAFQLLSRYMYPDNWNAVQRVLAMDQVGWAGIGFDGVFPQELAVLGVPCAVKVTVVAPGGPADEAGLLRGDYIVGLNGETFSDVMELQGDARHFRPGDTISLDVDRAEERISIDITLTSWSEIRELATGGVGL